MCLILLAVQPDARHRLVVAANRDEQYARPSAAAAWWPDHDDILGGRDLQAGGTWLGITCGGRFAAVTNFREDPPDPLPPRSRGALTAAFLSGQDSCGAYLRQVHAAASQYRGFNLIVSDGADCFYYSNREGEIRRLEAGFYGLSNQLLDCDWPKVIRGRRQLAGLSASDFPAGDLFALLACKGDGEPFSQSFIATERYGTTASTVVRVAAGGEVDFEERRFGPMGTPDGVLRFSFRSTR